MAQSKGKGSNKKVGVEPLADDVDIDDEVEPVEDESDVEEDELQQAQARQDADDDDDEDDEEDDEDEEVEEPEDDASEDDDEDEDEKVDDDAVEKFAPYVYSGEEDTTWNLGGLFSDVDDGETIYIYDVENEVFYKLMPVAVGELS